MIDWLNLVANALWIFACALALAVFSYASWSAAKDEIKLRTVLSSIGYKAIFHLAGLLFSLGLAVTVSNWLRTLL